MCGRKSLFHAVTSPEAKLQEKMLNKTHKMKSLAYSLLTKQYPPTNQSSHHQQHHRSTSVKKKENKGEKSESIKRSTFTEGQPRNRKDEMK